MASRISAQSEIESTQPDAEGEASARLIATAQSQSFGDAPLGSGPEFLAARTVEHIHQVRSDMEVLGREVAHTEVHGSLIRPNRIGARDSVGQSALEARFGFKQVLDRGPEEQALRLAGAGNESEVKAETRFIQHVVATHFRGEDAVEVVLDRVGVRESVAVIAPHDLGSDTDGDIGASGGVESLSVSESDFALTQPVGVEPRSNRNCSGCSGINPVLERGIGKPGDDGIPAEIDGQSTEEQAKADPGTKLDIFIAELAGNVGEL